MKKQVLNLGKALNKAEQKQINGGGGTVVCRYYHPGNIPPSNGNCTETLINNLTVEVCCRMHIPT